MQAEYTCRLAHETTSDVMEHDKLASIAILENNKILKDVNIIPITNK